ncbi:hypothetical protein PIB30_076550 [Stylosanthes scabra]|uniref:Uncharacterized protein n=1 Tax=Stylosanthes scabra TaxID=79078 RepID=A0ABU6VSX3_9FABA|nr:hypothetical protein [Stylosanthes scabra]
MASPSSSRTLPPKVSEPQPLQTIHHVPAPKVPLSSFTRDDSKKDKSYIAAPAMVASLEAFVDQDGILRAPNPLVESSELWQSQVFLPFKIDSITYSFLGPILTPKKLSSIKSFFPGPLGHFR